MLLMDERTGANRLMSIFWTITHATCWQDNRNFLPSRDSSGEVYKTTCDNRTWQEGKADSITKHPHHSVAGRVVFLCLDGRKSLDEGGCNQAGSSSMEWNQWHKCGMFNFPDPLLIFMSLLTLMVSVASSGPQKIV